MKAVDIDDVNFPGHAFNWSHVVLAPRAAIRTDKLNICHLVHLHVLLITSPVAAWKSQGNKNTKKRRESSYTFSPCTKMQLAREYTSLRLRAISSMKRG